MGNTSTNISRNVSRSKDAMGSRAAAAGQPGTVLPGASGGTVRIRLPKGSYTIDGDGNLTIHGGEAVSDRGTGDL